jgi:hypothetical protein
MLNESARAWGWRLLTAALIVLLVLCAYWVCRRLILGPDRFTIEQTSGVVSTVDGASYRVHGGHAGAQQAADTLATLNLRVIELIRHLRGRYAAGGAAAARYPARRRAVQRLLARYNPDNLAENSPRDPGGDTAYSLDKGAIVAICLRSRSGGAALHDLGVLTFVTFHELAHIAVEAIDHPPEFWSTFRFLLEEAEEGGIYTSPRYAQAPQWYCGLWVDYNPRYDSAVATIE